MYLKSVQMLMSDDPARQDASVLSRYPLQSFS